MNNKRSTDIGTGIFIKKNSLHVRNMCTVRAIKHKLSNPLKKIRLSNHVFSLTLFVIFFPPGNIPIWRTTAWTLYRNAVFPGYPPVVASGTHPSPQFYLWHGDTLMKVLYKGYPIIDMLIYWEGNK